MAKQRPALSTFDKRNQQVKQPEVKQPEVKKPPLSVFKPTQDLNVGEAHDLLMKKYEPEPPKVEPKQEVTVQPGDTLWGIAEKTMGAGDRWKELQGYSGVPEQLPVGTKLTPTPTPPLTPSPIEQPPITEPFKGVDVAQTMKQRMIDLTNAEPLKQPEATPTPTTNPLAMPTPEQLLGQSTMTPPPPMTTPIETPKPAITPETPIVPVPTPPPLDSFDTAKNPTQQYIGNQFGQNLVSKAGEILGENTKAAAQKTIPLIKQAFTDEGIDDPDTLAYAMATINHESSFTPKDEIPAGPNDPQWLKDAQANYDGGWAYHGRGHIQLTGKGNYDAVGKRIGVDLVNNPDLANNPDIAAKIAAVFFKDRGVSDYTKKGDFYNARTPVNGDTWNYQKVADEAEQWKKLIQPQSPEEIVRTGQYR